VELRHVVVAWLDHTKAVAAEHYLMVTDDDYERAAAMVRKTDHITDHSPAFSIRQRPSPETTTAVSPACASDTAVSIPPRGVDRPQESSGNLSDGRRPGTESGTLSAGSPDVVELLRLLAGLTPEERSALLDLARSASRGGRPARPPTATSRKRPSRRS